LEEADAVSALLELTQPPPSEEGKEAEGKEEDGDGDAEEEDAGVVNVGVEEIPDTNVQFEGRKAKIAYLGFDKTKGSVDVMVAGK
jgi:hypothetical protein